ncbi:hypothetical protein [Pseudomonas sp. zfem005]|uniref:hypothetical protein n=1 Tax=Pseudomonas sp. zfem005 TaxID=3078200 RepID=UPI002927D47E|nr:hypothetical protein [Pseudomonas sp. zfem005]MDU9413835.1 hypothetical protein [Pseudomonas sp. zfem005]
MAKERPANHINPVFTLAVLLIGIPLFLWWKMSTPDAVSGPAPEAATDEAAQVAFVPGPPEERWPNLSDAEWREVQRAGYSKRVSFNGIFKGMTFDDLREYQVWKHPESVGELKDDGTQVLFYRAGFAGEQIQLVFKSGYLEKVGCDPECRVSDLVRQRLGL